MGTGVVGFNLAKKSATMCDVNPHIINFYSSIHTGDICASTVRKFLIEEGKKLSTIGQDYYYEVRARFNLYKSSLDFLFLNRAGFNGMIRFNRKGEFNIPFCRKNERFSQSYITKIVNQVDKLSQRLKECKFDFICQDFKNTISFASKNDIIYCDPPYIDRHVDYYNGWTDTQEEDLFYSLSKFDGKFILSTWHHNTYRANKYIEKYWGSFNVTTKDHFYHVGGKEKNRTSMVEALVVNFEIPNLELHSPNTASQLTLL